MSAQMNLNDHLIEWNRFLLNDWRPALQVEAESKAEYEYQFALSKTSHRIKNPTIAASWAEALTSANEQIGVLNMKRRLAEANVEAMRKTLNYMEARADAIRSEVSSEREESKLHSVNKFVP